MLSLISDPLNQEYNIIASEFLEILRHFDRLKIQEILNRLNPIKEDILSKIQK